MIANVRSRSSDTRVIGGGVRIRDINSMGINSGLCTVDCHRFAMKSRSCMVGGGATFASNCIKICLLDSASSSVSNGALVSCGRGTRANSSTCNENCCSRIGSGTSGGMIVGVESCLTALGGISNKGGSGSEPDKRSASGISKNSCDSRPAGRCSSGPLVPNCFSARNLASGSNRSSGAKLKSNADSRAKRCSSICGVGSSRMFSDGGRGSGGAAGARVRRISSGTVSNTGTGALSGSASTAPSLDKGSKPVNNVRIDRSGRPDIDGGTFRVRRTVGGARSFVPSMFVIVVTLVLLVVNCGHHSSGCSWGSIGECWGIFWLFWFGLKILG